MTEQSSQEHKHGERTYYPRSYLSFITPWLWVLCALLLYVLCHRTSSLEEMLLSAQFLFAVPFFVGSWLGYLANLQKPATIAKIIKLTFWLFFAIILISIPILREGIICIIIASPILWLMVFSGALVMHWVCNKVWKSKALHSMALCAMLVLGVPFPEQDQTYQKSESIIIHSSPERIWQAINHIEDVSEQQFYQSSILLPFLGIPAPKSAVTVWENGQWVRKCQWHKGIYFDEPIISQIPNQQLRWQFNFYDDSVPKGTLDDHVTINGKHFKLLWGQYDIEKIDDTSSKLTFTIHYRITTNLNFYAGLWGEWVMNEFNRDILNLYKQRLESTIYS